MNSRLIAGGIAVLLAAVGAVVLVGYVRGADARAMSGLDTVQVLAAAAPIPAGTPAADLPALVTTKQIPASAALPDGAGSLDQLAGQVALVALEPGEQLLTGKFGAPPTAGPDTGPTVPPNLQQVTVLLELQRALGGRIKAGDTVGVLLSVQDSKQTHFSAHKVLVTLVQRAPTGAAGPADPASAAAPPADGSAPADLEGKLLVTVATTAPVAENIVFAANFGTVWLSDEPPTADESGTRVVDKDSVFR